MGTRRIRGFNFMGTFNLVFVLYIFILLYLMANHFLSREAVGRALITGSILYACLIMLFTLRRTKK